MAIVANTQGLLVTKITRNQFTGQALFRNRIVGVFADVRFVGDQFDSDAGGPAVFGIVDQFFDGRNWAGVFAFSDVGEVSADGDFG